MSHKELTVQEMCSQLIEFATTALLKSTHNETQTLKVIKVSIEKGIKSYKKELI